MDVITQSVKSITPYEFAKTLANSTPDEFAEFWLAFYKLANDEKLDAFAKAMAPESGSARRDALKRLIALTNYYIIAEEKQQNQ